MTAPAPALRPAFAGVASSPPPPVGADCPVVDMGRVRSRKARSRKALEKDPNAREWYIDWSPSLAGKLGTSAIRSGGVSPRWSIGSGLRTTSSEARSRATRSWRRSLRISASTHRRSARVSALRSSGLRVTTFTNWRSAGANSGGSLSNSSMRLTAWLGVVNPMTTGTPGAQVTDFPSGRWWARRGSNSRPQNLDALLSRTYARRFRLTPDCQQPELPRPTRRAAR